MTESDEHSHHVLKLMMDGDEEGLRIFLEDHGAAIKRGLREQFSTVHAEDRQAAFMQALYETWTNIHKFDPERGTLRAFVLWKARCRVKDFLRKKPREETRGFLDEIIADKLQLKAQCEWQSSQIQGLYLAMTELSDGEQAVIHLLIDSNGRITNSEIAEELGISTEHAAVNKCTALKKLRSHFRGENSDLRRGEH